MHAMHAVHAKSTVYSHHGQEGVTCVGRCRSQLPQLHLPDTVAQYPKINSHDQNGSMEELLSTCGVEDVVS